MKESALEKLRQGAAELGVELSASQVEQFSQYGDFLLEYNEKVNLTAITDEDEVAVKHFVDCLTAVKAIELRDGERLIDVGTGAGFPAVPLLILKPTLHVTLLDSLQKRLTFLEQLLQKLGLKARLTHGRAEDTARVAGEREHYDLVVSRAVAQLSILAELCLPFAKVGGEFLAMKGPAVGEELRTGKRAIETLGGKVERVVELRLPLSEEQRSLVVMKKVRATPPAYPRRAGLPKKTPLV